VTVFFISRCEDFKIFESYSFFLLFEKGYFGIGLASIINLGIVARNHFGLAATGGTGLNLINIGNGFLEVPFLML
jgi:hypothetical protein